MPVAMATFLPNTLCRLRLCILAWHLVLTSAVNLRTGAASSPQVEAGSGRRALLQFDSGGNASASLDAEMEGLQREMQASWSSWQEAYGTAASEVEGLNESATHLEELVESARRLGGGNAAVEYCQSFTSQGCSGCVSSHICGWCASSMTCVPGTKAHGVAGDGSLCPSAGAFTWGTCPGQSCGSYTACGTCTADANCGWCSAALPSPGGGCISGSEWGPIRVPGSVVECPAMSWVHRNSESSNECPGVR
mmetsp:Transcript_33833/g.79063  ORF Transcript_33833/g.79063 Transcript_33833/m.79063 type:complete len:250 (+) Transcript_33833:70-819(+)